MINYTYTSQHFMHQLIFSTGVFFMFHLYANFFTNSLTNYGARTNKLLRSDCDFTFKGFQTRNPKFLSL